MDKNFRHSNLLTRLREIHETIGEDSAILDPQIARARVAHEQNAVVRPG